MLDSDIFNLRGMNYHKYSMLLLRVAVSGLFIAHGIMRMANGTVGGFGEFLNTKGFMIGSILAWLIAFFEIVGGSLMAAGKWQRPIALGFVFHQVMGIALVHAKNGWFVVGAGTGGMEYSVLLIVCSLVIAANRS